MSVKKPVVAIAEPVLMNCPVCGKRSYSLSGTHPQCAVRQADALAREKVLEPRAATKKK